MFALLKLYQADAATGDARLAWQGGALLLFVSLIFPLSFIANGSPSDGRWKGSLSSGFSVVCRIAVCDWLA